MVKEGLTGPSPVVKKEAIASAGAQRPRHTVHQHKGGQKIAEKLQKKS
jgi:hypothetical protein